MIRAIRPYLVLSLVIVFIIETLLGLKWLEVVEGVLAIAALLVSYRAAKGMFQIVSGLFLAAGAVCVVWGDIPLAKVPAMFAGNAMLISLLFMLPFINRSMRLGGYDRQLGRWLQARSSNLGQLYIRSVLVSYVLSVFLFFATFPFMHRVLGKYFPNAESDLAKKFTSTSMLRGFATVGAWSPIEPLVALGLVVTGVSYVALLPWLLLASVIILGIAMLWSIPYRRTPLESPRNGDTPKPPAPAKALSMLFALGMLIGSAELLHVVTGISFFEAMTLVLLPFSMLWAYSLRRLRSYIALTRKQWNEQTDGLRHMLVLFVAFGFFNGAVVHTPLIELAAAPIQLLSTWPALLLLLVFLVSFLLPIAGIHPFVTIGVFGVFLQPVLGDINPMSVAIVLILSSLCSASMGSFNSTVTIVSGLVQVNPYRITGWNFAFGFLYGLVGYAIGVLLL